jgi:hypothetical protein
MRGTVCFTSPSVDAHIRLCTVQINSFKKEVDSMFGSGEQEKVYLDDTPDIQYNKVCSSIGCTPALRPRVEEVRCCDSVYVRHYYVGAA